MTDHDNSQGEPTMEEILASIRRIISEDNDETETSTAQGPQAGESGSADEATDKAARNEDAEVLELSPSQMVTGDNPAPGRETKLNGLDKDASSAEAEPKSEANKGSARPEAPANTSFSNADNRESFKAEAANEVEETLLSPEVATAAAAAFGALSKDVTVSRSGDTRSLEDLVQEMMKPMLKEWLEDNLPPLVEEVVEREVRRLSHRRVRR